MYDLLFYEYPFYSLWCHWWAKMNWRNMTPLANRFAILSYESSPTILQVGSSLIQTCRIWDFKQQPKLLQPSICSQNNKHLWMLFNGLAPLGTFIVVYSTLSDVTTSHGCPVHSEHLTFLWGPLFSLGFGACVNLHQNLIRWMMLHPETWSVSLAFFYAFTDNNQTSFENKYTRF